MIDPNTDLAFFLRFAPPRLNLVTELKSDAGSSSGIARDPGEVDLELALIFLKLFSGTAKFRVKSYCTVQGQQTAMV